MGLDLVELAMAIEAEFSIAIPDAVGETLGTVGQIRDFVREILSARGETPDEVDLWDRVRRVVAHQSGVDARTLEPETHLVDDLGMD